MTDGEDHDDPARVHQSCLNDRAREQTLGRPAIQIELKAVGFMRASGLELEQGHMARGGAHETVNRPPDGAIAGVHRERDLVQPFTAFVELPDVWMRADRAICRDSLPGYLHRAAVRRHSGDVRWLEHAADAVDVSVDGIEVEPESLQHAVDQGPDQAMPLRLEPRANLVWRRLWGRAPGEARPLFAASCPEPGRGAKSDACVDDPSA